MTNLVSPRAFHCIISATTLLQKRETSLLKRRQFFESWLRLRSGQLTFYTSPSRLWVFRIEYTAYLDHAALSYSDHVENSTSVSIKGETFTAFLNIRTGFVEAFNYGFPFFQWRFVKLASLLWH